jgi:hypothetical protein
MTPEIISDQEEYFRSQGSIEPLKTSYPISLVGG